MRAAVIPTLALPLLLAHCGSKGDLIIGNLEPVATGGSSVVPQGGIGAVGNSAGTETSGGGGGSAGSNTDGGVSGTAGVSTQAGAPDNAGGDGSGCVGDEQPPVDSLLHRYSFDGTGTAVLDSVGTANGSLVGGAMLDGSGVLTLPGNRDGQPDQYANLPNGLISSLAEVSIVVWTTWVGGAGYQRVFDFGISDTGEGQGNSGKSYLAVMPSTGFANGTGLGAEIAAPGFPTTGLPSPEMMNNRPAVVGFVLRSGVNVGLFLDGELLIETPTTLKLSDIKDVNDFVGESQWSKDHPYHGSYDEFRIYGAALTACQLRVLVDRGPDAL